MPQKNESQSGDADKKKHDWPTRRVTLVGGLIAIVAAMLPVVIPPVMSSLKSSSSDDRRPPTSPRYGWAPPLILPVGTHDIDVDALNGVGDGKPDLTTEQPFPGTGGGDFRAVENYDPYFLIMLQKKIPSVKQCQPRVAFEPDEAPSNRNILDAGEYMCLEGSKGSVVLLSASPGGANFELYPSTRTPQGANSAKVKATTPDPCKLKPDGDWVCPQKR